MSEAFILDDVDRALIRATQGGLPLASNPYQQIADTLELTEAEVITRLENFLQIGIIRRIGVVPNHYRLGYVANGMTVWDVEDDMLNELGPKVGALACVSHCYRRPRHLPEWPYNFFAMVHGRTRGDVAVGVEQIQLVLGSSVRTSDILYSSRILKKTGLRITE